jgi:putative DNA primase/helicase
MSNYSIDFNDLKGRWAAVLSEVLPYAASTYNHKHQPCPFCGGNDRFRFTNIELFMCTHCMGKPLTPAQFIAKSKGIDIGAVSKLLGERFGNKPLPQKQETYKPMVSNENAIIPAPQELTYIEGSYVSLLTKTGSSRNYQYNKMFPWKTIDNGIVGYIGRTPQKVCHQIFWTEKGWAQGSLGQGRPLFGLQSLSIEGPVYIVEGEKTCTFAQEQLNAAVITWTGGATAVKTPDWSVINEREIILCPDNDDPGFKAMAYVKQVLQANNTISTFKPPEELPEHWDVADYNDPEMPLKEFIGSHSISDAKIIEEKKEQSEKGMDTLSRDIRPLGFDKEKLFFLPAGKLQVIEMNANTLGKGQLRSLADIDIWAKVFPKDSLIDPVNWDTAANWVIRECEKKKVYDQSNIRGNGIWRDKVDTVAHMGDHLLVENKRVELNHYPSKFVYAQRPRKLELPKVEMSDQEKELLVDLANRFSWAEQSSSTMLLSFLIAAPLAGRLHWRPSIWINGEKGAGKSTILEWFIKPCLAGLHIGVEGDTTEAGLRQLIGCDSLPVLFDEPEADTFKTCEALQKLVRFIRSCASGSSSMITKGSAHGTAVQYQAQCMFLLASINVITLSPQDKDRISVLELEKGSGQAQWKETEAMLKSLPEDISMKLIDFIIRESNWILQVIEVFCDYIAKETGSQRIGDQYGILSIGEYILMNKPGKIPSEKEMSQHIDSKLWETIQTNNKDTNETDFVSYLANILLQIEDGDTGRRKELSLRECFDIANNTAPFVFESVRKNTEAALGRRGMQVKDGRVSFVRNSHNLLKLFMDKPQFANYVGILKRLPESEDRRVRIGGTQFYAVSVPLKLFGEQNWVEGKDEPKKEKPVVKETLEEINNEIEW